MKTIFVHIGMPKTGSTSIQAFFSTHRHVLEEEGILYPRLFCSGGAHFDFSSAFGFGASKKNITSNHLNDSLLELEKEINGANFNKVIFSSENFVLDGDVDLLYSFLYTLDAKLKIVVYLRRHDKWWPSAYQQSIKQVNNPPWGSTFKEFLDFQNSFGYKYWDYCSLIDRWASVFGRENILVRPFEKSQMKEGDVLQDFLDVIGVNDISDKLRGSINKPRSIANDSLNAKALILMDVYSRLNVAENIKRKLKKHAESIESDINVSSLCSPYILEEILKDNFKDYEYIAKEYLGRDDGRLFYDGVKFEESPILDFDNNVWLVQETIEALKDLF